MNDALAEGARLDVPADEAVSPVIALARAAAAGDSEATTKLLRVLAPRLVRIVRAVIGASHPDVDDATQLALIGFVQALPAYRGDCDPLAYGRVIAVRAAIAARKRARLVQSRRDDGAETDAVPASRPNPGEAADSEQRKELLRELLSELPEEQAETLALRVVLGCSLEEVAERTGVPLNTVRSRVRLAKERLKARIESDAGLRDALDLEALS
jgi:RNA polymerase sigma-70 factor (ECF subfamily)